MFELMPMWRYWFGLVFAWLLVPEVAVAQDCVLKAPLTVKDLQGGYTGETGTVWTIAPDCSFTVARQIGAKIGDPHRRGKLTPEQQSRLHDLMRKIEGAALPEALGSSPQANARKVTFRYGDQAAALNLAPGGGELHSLHAAAIKEMTGG